MQTEQDKVFLMYDLDVDGMLEQLQKIPNAELLVSNPCVELWFFLHYQEQKAEITSEKCVQKYQKVSKGYKKGVLSEDEKKVLAENRELAVDRAKKLAAFKNPSTTVFKLLEELIIL